MTKLNKFLLVTAVIVTATAITKFVKPQPQRLSRAYSLHVIQLHDGWGYDILKHNKIYIHQTNIPAVEGKTNFPDKYSATKTGMLVLKKLQNNKLPTITKKELDSLQVKL